MFKSPGEEQEPTACLKECITALTNYLVDEVDDRNLVGLRIRNTENVQNKVFDDVNSLIPIWSEIYFPKSFRVMLGMV